MAGAFEQAFDLLEAQSGGTCVIDTGSGLIIIRMNDVRSIRLNLF